MSGEKKDKKKDKPEFVASTNPTMDAYFANASSARDKLRIPRGFWETNKDGAEVKEAEEGAAELSKFLGPEKNNPPQLWKRGLSLSVLMSIKQELEKQQELQVGEDGKILPKWESHIHLDKDRNMICPGEKLSAYIVFAETKAAKETYFEHIERIFAKNEAEAKTEEDKAKVRQEKADNMGTVNVFVSHAWRYDYCHVVQCVQDWETNYRVEERCPKKKFFYFLDYFAVSQHNAADDLKKIEFAIENAKAILCVASPYDKPVTLTRSWCTMEIAFAHLYHTQLHISFLPGEDKQFKMQFSDKKQSKMIKRGFEDIDTKLATAYNKDDRRQIQNRIAAMGGYAHINKLVKQALRQWLISKAKGFAGEEAKLMKKYEGQSADKLKTTHTKRFQILKNTATFLRQEGQLEKSLEILGNALKALKDLKKAQDEVFEEEKTSEDDRKVEDKKWKELYLGTINSKGNTLWELNQFDKALPVYKEALGGRNELLGKGHVDTLQSKLNIARCYVDLELFADAEKLLQENCQGWKDYVDKVSKGGDKTKLEKCVYKQYWPLGDLANCLSRNFRKEHKLPSKEVDEYFSRALDGLRATKGQNYYFTNYYQMLLAEHQFALVKFADRKRTAMGRELFAQAKQNVSDAFGFFRRNEGQDHPATLSAFKLLKQMLKHEDSDKGSEEARKYKEIQANLFKRNWISSDECKEEFSNERAKNRRRNTLRVMHWNVLADKLAYGDLIKDDFGSERKHIHWEIDAPEGKGSQRSLGPLAENTSPRRSVTQAVQSTRKKKHKWTRVDDRSQSEQQHQKKLNDLTAKAEERRQTFKHGRRSKIEAEILRVKPDVVVLVELDKRLDIGMQLDIHDTYQSIWKKKKKDFYEDGTGIFYNTKRLKKVDELMTFIESPKGKKNDQVIVAAELAPTSDNETDDFESFVVCGIHLKSKKKQDGEKTRVEQAKNVWEQLRKKWPNKEIVLTSDLNAEADGYESTCLNYSPECHPWLLKQGLQSVYPAVMKKEPSITSWKKRVPPNAEEEGKEGEVFKYTIDFIFATKGITPLAVLDVPSEDQFKPILNTLLPAEQCGSDHLPLVCELEFKSGPLNLQPMDRRATEKVPHITDSERSEAIKWAIQAHQEEAAHKRQSLRENPNQLVSRTVECKNFGSLSGALLENKFAPAEAADHEKSSGCLAAFGC